jgi:hypothetical protein
MMSDRLVKNKVTLEEVLRLKRAERPESSFWAQFEQQLRAKQLAAIVERRPWWHLDFSRFSAGVAKLRVPLGATAVIALSLVTMREYRKAEFSSVVEPRADVSANTSSEITRLDEMHVAAAAAHPARVAASGSEFGPAAGGSLLTAEVQPPVSTAVASTISREAHPAEINGMNHGNQDSWAVAADSGSHGFAAIRTASLFLDDSLVSAGTEMTGLGRVSSQHELVEPLTQVTAPMESRRERLAALVAPASMKRSSAKSSTERVRDRMISRLSEDELYSSVSRLGVAKGGLSLNF